MGQSFGGFCAITYLSFFPEGLREAFLFGGLPPLVDSPDPVYRRTFKKVIERNQAYYTKYPEDVERVHNICKLLQRFGDTTVRDTTSQGFITARRFMQIGLHLGFHGGLDTVHELVLKADSDLTFVGHLTKPTVVKIESLLPFNDHILYSILHEPIYCQGKAANWSCSRIQKEKEYAELFDIPKESGTKPIFFTGEMVFKLPVLGKKEVDRNPWLLTLAWKMERSRSELPMRFME